MNKQIDIATMRERARAGFNAVVEVAKDPGNFRMSIPAQPGDTDRLLCQVTEDVESLCDEVERLRAALERIREMAVEDIRQERVFVCHSFIYQIEANARAALGLAQTSPSPSNA